MGRVLIPIEGSDLRGRHRLLQDLADHAGPTLSGIQVNIESSSRIEDLEAF